jgi:hypothetical protein
MKIAFRVIFIFKMAAEKIGKISMFSNFNENWYLGLFWRPLTIWRFCWQPFWKWWPRKNDPECKFHHYQSIPDFKITLDINFHWNMIRPLLIFTGRWIPISRGAFRSSNFQNGRRCHGNRERISKSLTSLISETAKGISTKLGIYIKEGW